MPGIVKIFSYKDIPGENQIGGIIADEPFLADGEVHFRGQPVLLIAAEYEDAAEEALQAIKIEIEPLPVITMQRFPDGGEFEFNLPEGVNLERGPIAGGMLRKTGPGGAMSYSFARPRYGTNGSGSTQCEASSGTGVSCCDSKRSRHASL